jgi:hypothetical protein
MPATCVPWPLDVSLVGRLSAYSAAAGRAGVASSNVTSSARLASVFTFATVLLGYRSPGWYSPSTPESRIAMPTPRPV